MPTIRQFLPSLLLVTLVATAITPPLSRSGQSVVDDPVRPVIVSGTEIGAFLGTPVDELFVYAYGIDTWTQIPFQIDEKTLNEDGKRVYTSEGDGQIEADEELVFMLKDMGEQAPPAAWLDGALTDYSIELTVNARDGSPRWAYLFHGPELSQMFTEDYVRFSGPAQRVIAERYEAGFLDNGAGLGELRLNGSGVDILDRTKVRLQVVVLAIFRRTITEDDIEGEPVVPVKDGPVRLIRGEAGGFAYGSLFQEQNEISLSDVPVPGASLESFRVSWDFNEQIVATSTLTVYLDANMSEPVVIDGQPDAVPTQPVPAWRQISHPTGTIIVTIDLSSVGGTQRNYYRDDDTFDNNDTGDGRSYGDTGFSVDTPNASFSLNTSLLVLPPTEENVGAAYAEWLAQPLAVTATRRTPAGPLGRKVYLPLIRR
ncbi:MAG: hypothetical protein ACE5LU_06155 [Anaerolineae bacterium]